MGRKLVIVLLAGLLFSILLATPRASAGSDTEYLKYTSESETYRENVMPPTDGGVSPAPSAPAAPVAVSPPVVSSSPVVYSSVPPSPDFAISITPASRTVTRGESTTYTVTVKSIGGYSGQVSLSVSGLPSGAGYSLPSRVTPPANGSAVASLTVTTTTSAATGNSTITVTGTGSGTKSASAGLTVTAPTPPPPIIPPPTPALPEMPIFYPHDKQGYATYPMLTPSGSTVYGVAPLDYYGGNSMAAIGTTTLAAAEANAVAKGGVVDTVVGVVNKVQQGLNTIVAKCLSVIQQIASVLKNFLSGIFR